MLRRWNTLSRNNPSKSVLSIFDELNRGLNFFLRDWDSVDRSLFNRGFSLPQQAAAPRVDAFEQENHLLFVAEVPGVSEKDIKLTVNSDSMTFSAKRNMEVPEGHEQHLRERSSFEFSRSFNFPCKVDVEDVTASLKDGILEIKIAKAAEAQPRHIEVSVG